MDSVEFELKTWLLNFKLLSGNSLWVTETFLIIFVALLFDFFQKKIIKQLTLKFKNTKNPWDDAVIGAISKPISLFIWLWGVSIAAYVVFDSNNIEIGEAIGQIREIGSILILTWFVLRLISRFEQNIIDIKKNRIKKYDVTTVQAVAKLLRISVLITGFLIVLQQLGISVSGVLAFGGIGGIAIGFAAKDLLANFFGGLMIYLDRPFKVGDWIRSPDRKIEGTVEVIGWRLTKIRRFDKRPLYVPNSFFTSIAVENPSRMTHRRIYETIGIRYDDNKQLKPIIDGIKAMLKTHKEIDTTQTLIVNFNSFAPSSLDFFVYTFTKTTDWIKYHEVKQDILLKIMDVIEQNGAEIAFPTSTIHLANQIETGMVVSQSNCKN